MNRPILAAALIFLAACASNSGPNSGPSGILGVAGTSSSASSNERWVCHGGRHPKWKKVALPAVAAHRRHGDTVVDSRRQVNTPCIR